MCTVEKGVVFMGVAFRELPGGAPGGDYLSRAIVDCRGAPTTDTAFMGLTSRRWITIAGTVAHRRPGTQPAYAGCGSTSLQLRGHTERWRTSANNSGLGTTVVKPPRKAVRDLPDRSGSKDSRRGPSRQVSSACSPGHVRRSSSR